MNFEIIFSWLVLSKWPSSCSVSYSFVYYLAFQAALRFGQNNHVNTAEISLFKKEISEILFPLQGSA